MSIYRSEVPLVHLRNISKHFGEGETRLGLAGVDKDEAKRRAIELLEYLEVGHRKDAMPVPSSKRPRSSP